MGNTGIMNNRGLNDIALVNNNNNNNPNDGVIELDIVDACANVEISIDEDIDINDLTRAYNQSHNSIPAFLSPVFPHRTNNTKFVVTILGKPSGKSGVFYLKAKIIQGVLTKYNSAFKLRGYRPTIRVTSSGTSPPLVSEINRMMKPVNSRDLVTRITGLSLSCMSHSTPET
jgi:hypothetical protein